MKYVDEFRDGALACGLAHTIAAEVDPGRSYRLMEFCGGHTHAISRYGLLDLLPPAVHMIHGPGCPVCVLPIGRIDSAIELAQQGTSKNRREPLEGKAHRAQNPRQHKGYGEGTNTEQRSHSTAQQVFRGAQQHGVILCTYADTLRVPASGRSSLLKAKAQGADIRMVYSASDALLIAQQNPEREVVFFAIGFETTTPPSAAIIKQAAHLELTNFSVYCSHVLTPAAMVHIMESEGQPDAVALDGFVGPSHVSTIIGSAPYEAFAARYRRPVVIAGFEPLDVLQSILMLVRQINQGRAEVENQFIRAVTRAGNQKAQALTAEIFELRASFDWRGLGEVPYSALAIRPEYARFDAERRYAMVYRQVADHKTCECAAILRGHKRPADCKAFGTACTPEHPIGACMVSSEGACAAHYTYGRFRLEPNAEPKTQTDLVQ